MLPVVERITNDMMQVMRVIETKKAIQIKNFETQTVQIMERMDAQDRHRLIRECDEPYQYSMVLPCPDMVVAAGKKDDGRFIFIEVSYE